MKSRESPLVNAAWLHEHMTNVETIGMVLQNLQAIHEIVGMAIHKISNSYGMVADYWAVNDSIEPAARPTANFKDKASMIAGVTA